MVNFGLAPATRDLENSTPMPLLRLALGLSYFAADSVIVSSEWTDLNLIKFEFNTLFDD